MQKSTKVIEKITFNLNEASGINLKFKMNANVNEAQLTDSII